MVRGERHIKTTKPHIRQGMVRHHARATYPPRYAPPEPPSAPGARRDALCISACSTMPPCGCCAARCGASDPTSICISRHSCTTDVRAQDNRAQGLASLQGPRIIRAGKSFTVAHLLRFGHNLHQVIRTESSSRHQRGKLRIRASRVYSIFHARVDVCGYCYFNRIFEHLADTPGASSPEKEKKKKAGSNTCSRDADVAPTGESNTKRRLVQSKKKKISLFQ